MSRDFRTALKVGLPFLTFVVGGSFGLSFFTQVRYDVVDYHRGGAGTSIRPKEKPPPFDINEELKEMQSKLDIQNWEYVKVKRPDEE